jgi:IS5 family transposase
LKTGNRLYSGRGWAAHKNAERIASAKLRQEAWAALSPAEQLEALDRRLGAGSGAERQRSRIAAKLTGAQRRAASKRRAG